MPNNTVAVNCSCVGGGAQTIWVLCEDNQSATDDWVNAEIEHQNAGALVGKWYITYRGR